MSTPKPAHESRTLRFNSLCSWITGALAALPDVLGYVIELAGEPTIAAAVSGFIPIKYRALIAAIVFVVTQRNRQLRLQTTAPIANSAAASQSKP